MLIGLIVALIFGVSGAESEFASYIPNLKKEIRQNVHEEARKDTLMVLLKEYDKFNKKYDKEKKKLLKSVNKAATDRTVSTEVFLQKYDDYYEARIQMVSQLISYRLMFQEKLTQYELFMMTEKALETSKKDDKKEVKQIGKNEKKLNKAFQGMSDIVLKHFEDNTKMEIVSEHLLKFEGTIYSYVDEARSHVLQRKLMLNAQNASREDIEDIFKRTNELRYQASRDYAALREVIIENTDASQWKAINKELKVFLQKR